jgi:hypothetical protein
VDVKVRANAFVLYVHVHVPFFFCCSAVLCWDNLLMDIVLISSLLRMRHACTAYRQEQNNQEPYHECLRSLRKCAFPELLIWNAPSLWSKVVPSLNAQQKIRYFIVADYLGLLQTFSHFSGPLQTVITLLSHFLRMLWIPQDSIELQRILR